MIKKIAMASAAAALLLAAPASAQDASQAPIWAPWIPVTAVTVSPEPPVRAAPRARVQVAATVDVQPASQPVESRSLFRYDRFWIVGSFR